MAIKKNEKTGRYRIDFRDQHKVRSRVYYDTKKAATIALADITGKVTTGEYVSPRKTPTFEAAGAEWLKGRGDRRPGTLANWRAQLERHLYPAIGHLRLDLINVQRIERLRSELQRPVEPGRAPLGAGTAGNIITTLGAVLKAAVRHGTLSSNPVDKIERHFIASKELKPGDEDLRGKLDPQSILSPAEISKMLDAAEPGHFRTLLTTACLTGMRIDELLALRWTDVELGSVDAAASATGRGTISVRQSLTWARGRGEPTQPRFFPPKTKAGLRAIPIQAALVSALKIWKLQCPAGDLVFPAADGRPTHRATTSKHGLWPALRRAGLRRVTMHSLRHSYASTLIAGGAAITEVQGLLGHADPAITLRVYSHWFKDVATDSVDKLADAMLGKSGNPKLATIGHNLATFPKLTA